MPTLTDLKAEHNKLAIQAHEIVADANLSAAEIREALDKIEGNAENPEKGTIHWYQAQIADAEYLEEKRKAYAGVTTQEETPVEAPAPKSIGEQIVASAAFKEYADSIKAGGGVRSSKPIEVFNAALGVGDIGTNVIEPQRQPGILPVLFERLTVADLMPSATTTSPVVRYVVETAATNAAATVAEKGAKPESTLDFDVVDEPVRKIATIFKVTDEMLEDFDQFLGYVNGRLVLFVRIKEEQQLLTGDGTAPNISGLLDRALTAAQAIGTDTIAVAVHKEITKVRVASFLDPTGIVFHPNNWQAARLEQDANQQFYGGGPFTGPYGVNGIAGDTYWGLPAVVTQAMTEDTVLLGAFRTAAQVFRRSGITVDMTNSDGDDFKNNITTVRAEERLALAVYRPSAFGTVTLGA